MRKVLPLLPLFMVSTGLQAKVNPPSGFSVAGSVGWVHSSDKRGHEHKLASGSSSSSSSTSSSNAVLSQDASSNALAVGGVLGYQHYMKKLLLGVELGAFYGKDSGAKANYTGGAGELRTSVMTMPFTATLDGKIGYGNGWLTPFGLLGVSLDYLKHQLTLTPVAGDAEKEEASSMGCCLRVGAGLRVEYGRMFVDVAYAFGYGFSPTFTHKEEGTNNELIFKAEHRMTNEVKMTVGTRF